MCQGVKYKIHSPFGKFSFDETTQKLMQYLQIFLEIADDIIGEQHEKSKGKPWKSVLSKNHSISLVEFVKYS